MKKNYFFVVFFFVVFFVNGQNWVRQYPFTEHETLYDIDFDGTGNGWAVGNNSIVMHTENSGVLWTFQAAPAAGGRLEAVVVVPGTNGMIGFAGGDRLLQTSDGGKTWLEVENGIGSIRKIQAFNKDSIVVSGRIKCMITSDGGENWTVFSMPPAAANCAFFIDLNNGWIGSGGYDKAQVYKTSNGGQSWNLANAVQYPVIAGLHFLNESTGFMASRNWVLKTTDGGVNWDTLNATKLPTITDIHAINEQEIWTSLHNGSYFFTKNGGTDWTLKNPNLIGVNSLKGIYATDEGKVWTTGNYTSVLYSEDRGDNWADQVPGQKGIINKADFLTEKIGFAVGNEGIILKTTDGGAFWEDLSFQNAESYFDVKVIDENRVVILSGDKLVFSSNGGADWSEKTTDATGTLTSFYVKSATEIFVTSKNGEIVRTQDGGSFWSFVYNENAHLSDIEFIDSQNAVATGYNGLILKSTNGGLNWSEKRNDNVNQFENAIFSSNLEGWVVASNYIDSIYHTADGGETWEGEKIGSKLFWHDVAFMDADTGWVVGGSSGSGRILKTTDGGESWETDYSGGLNFRFINAPIQNEKIVWAGGLGGNILKFSPCSTVLTISNLEGDSTPCAGDTIYYEVQQTGIDIFSWTVPGDWVIYGNPNTAKIEVIVGDQSGVISVKGANSCGDSTAVLTLQATPFVNSSVEISEDNEVLTATAANVASYEWLRYGEEVTGAGSAVFTPATGGKYSLKVTFNNGCVKYSNAIMVSITSSETLKSRVLHLFPNPANNQLFLKTELNERAKIEIVDMLGAVRYASVLTSSVVDISNLKEGFYIVTVEQNNEKLVSKLLIAR